METDGAGFLIILLVLAFSGFAASLFFNLSAEWGLNILPIDWSNYEGILFFGAFLIFGVGVILSAVEPGAVFNEDGVELNLEGCPEWMKILAGASLVYTVLSMFFLASFRDITESEWNTSIFSGFCLVSYSWGFASFYSKMKREVAKKF